MDSLPLAPPDPILGLLIHDVARLMRRRFTHLAREAQMPLSRSQCSVLIRLARSEGMSQAKLAHCLDIEPIALVRMVDRLEEAGFVERRLNPKDRRVWMLYLLPAATPMLEQIRRMAEILRQETLNGLSERGRQALIDDLTLLKGNLSALQPVAERRSIPRPASSAPVEEYVGKDA